LLLINVSIATTTTHFTTLYPFVLLEKEKQTERPDQQMSLKVFLLPDFWESVLSGIRIYDATSIPEDASNIDNNNG